MPRSLALSIILLLAGCVHADPPLPVCDGSDRHPANPHGSILAAGTPAPGPETGPAEPAGGCP